MIDKYCYLIHSLYSDFNNYLCNVLFPAQYPV